MLSVPPLKNPRRAVPTVQPSSVSRLQQSLHRAQAHAVLLSQTKLGHADPEPINDIADVRLAQPVTQPVTQPR
jgi:hypothetical protein